MKTNKRATDTTAKIKALPSGSFYVYADSDGKQYTVARFIKDWFTLQHGDSPTNMRTDFRYQGTAEDVAAKIDAMGLSFRGEKWATRRSVWG